MSTTADVPPAGGGKRSRGAGGTTDEEETQFVEDGTFAISPITAVTTLTLTLALA